MSNQAYNKLTLQEVLAKSRSVLNGLTLDLTREAFELLIERCYNIGLAIHLTDGYRSIAKQREIYNQGRTPESKARGEVIVSNAIPGKSKHNYSLAGDIRFIDNGYKFFADFNQNSISDIIDVVTQAKLIGFTWGGDFTTIDDKPHFEFSFGLSGSDLLNGKRWSKAQMDAALTKVRKLKGGTPITGSDNGMNDQEKKEFEALKVTVEESAIKMDLQKNAIDALNKKVNITANQTPPPWAHALIKKAKDAGIIKDSNDKSQIYLEMLQTLDNLGLIDDYILAKGGNKK